MDKVFVIMPFSSTTTCTEAEWTEIYETVFKPAVEECGYICERAFPSTGSLIKSIIHELKNSYIVLADITDRNANVFYELGVRHALSTRTIIVAQDANHVPSDLRGYWFLTYGIRPAQVIKFKNDIKKVISEIVANPDRSDSPISDYLNYELIGISNYISRENIKKLSALFTELSSNINTLVEIKNNQKYISLISYDCLSLLLNTLYLDIGSTNLRKCHELRHGLKTIHFGLGTQPPFIDELISIANEVLEEILEIKRRLSLGRFDEPENISTMLWEPITDETPLENRDQNNSVRKYSRSVEISETNMKELRDHFKKSDNK